MSLALIVDKCLNKIKENILYKIFTLNSLKHEVYRENKLVVEVEGRIPNNLYPVCISHSAAALLLHPAVKHGKSEISQQNVVLRERGERERDGRKMLC